VSGTTGHTPSLPRALLVCEGTKSRVFVDQTKKKKAGAPARAERYCGGASKRPADGPLSPTVLEPSR